MGRGLQPLGRQASTEIIEEQTAKRSRPVWGSSGPTMLPTVGTLPLSTAAADRDHRSCTREIIRAI